MIEGVKPLRIASVLMVLAAVLTFSQEARTPTIPFTGKLVLFEDGDFWEWESTSWSGLSWQPSDVYRSRVVLHKVSETSDSRTLDAWVYFPDPTIPLERTPTGKVSERPLVVIQKNRFHQNLRTRDCFADWTFVLKSTTGSEGKKEGQAGLILFPGRFEEASPLLAGSWFTRKKVGNRTDGPRFIRYEAFSTTYGQATAAVYIEDVGESTLRAWFSPQVGVDVKWSTERGWETGGNRYLDTSQTILTRTNVDPRR